MPGSVRRSSPLRRRVEAEPATTADEPDNRGAFGRAPAAQYHPVMADEPQPPQPLTRLAAVGWSIMLGIVSAVAALIGIFIWAATRSGLAFAARGADGPLVFALIFGGAIGLVLSPLHLLLLYRRPEVAMFKLVWGMTLSVTLLTGILSGPFCVVLSIITSIVAVICASLGLPRIHAATPGICSACDYQVDALQRCPECGTPNTSATPRILPAISPLAATIIAVIWLGLVAVNVAFALHFMDTW